MWMENFFIPPINTQILNIIPREDLCKDPGLGPTLSPSWLDD